MLQRVPGAMAFLGAFIWAGGQRRWVTPVVAVVCGLVMTYVFVGVVYVSVPTGVGVFDTLKAVAKLVLTELRRGGS